jgi:hypothetical protein
MEMRSSRRGRGVSQDSESRVAVPLGRQA